PTTSRCTRTPQAIRSAFAGCNGARLSDGRPRSARLPSRNVARKKRLRSIGSDGGEVPDEAGQEGGIMARRFVIGSAAVLAAVLMLAGSASAIAPKIVVTTVDFVGPDAYYTNLCGAPIDFF